MYWPVGPDEEGDGAGGGASLAAAGVHDPADDDHHWSQEIPAELVAWGEWEQARDELEGAYYAAHPNGPDDGSTPPEFPPPPASAGVQPPTLPAQLEKGPLNHAAYVTQGSGDDNSILPKPDHSVINHLAASPIKGGFLSVGVTTRYKRKVRRPLSLSSLRRRRRGRRTDPLPPLPLPLSRARPRPAQFVTIVRPPLSLPVSSTRCAY